MTDLLPTAEPFVTERKRIQDHLRGILDDIETAIGILGERRGLCEAWDRINDELASVTD